MSEPADPARRPPIWRTAVLVMLCVLASMISFVFSETGQTEMAAVGLLGTLAVVCVPFALCWRHRAPLAITFATAGVAVALPVGTSTALVALVSLFSRRFDRRVWWATAAVGVATAVTFVRDLLAPTMGASFLKSILGPPAAPPSTEVDLNWWVVPIVVALALGPAVAAGLVRRANRRSRAADQRAVAEGERAAAAGERAEVAGHRSQRLGGELARQRERERIAREVHDVLGHRLSLLNLHAGALEANAGGDSELAQSAALVRDSAARSMADLRSLLTVLREEPDQDPSMREPRLADLPAMIEETVATGVPVSSSVYLDQAESADPALARAVYRVVQELLTNARRHAPAAQVRLTVNGGPREGITIDARNPYRPGESGSGSRSAGTSSGLGLQGVAERVELLDGRLSYGLDDGGATFRVTVALPWR